MLLLVSRAKILSSLMGDGVKFQYQIDSNLRSEKDPSMVD